VPVCYFSMGGWFYGITVGLNVKNVFLRRSQFRLSEAEYFALAFARRLVAGKIRNQRTLLQRNHVEPNRGTLAAMKEMADRAELARSLEELLGLEGNGARLYFGDFAGMIKPDEAPGAAGLTFDFEGRELSCEHAGRRVVRYEHDGSVTVIADRYNGKLLNSPNDIVVHPDGSVWFTDPPYGILGNYEGNPAKQELKEAVYRVDAKTAKIEIVTDALDKPNGICFSPDYRKLYLCDTGVPRDIQVFDLVDNKLRNQTRFTDMKLNGRSGLADGIRADVDGNIWAGANGGAGYDGVHVFSPQGQRIGMILLPEICANLCFGGPKRNRLYICATSSLYAIYVNACGASWPS